MSYYCGVDIGGTFTDCVLVDETGTITLAKASSTPQDFSQGFLDAIEEAARQRGIDPEGVFGEIELLLHGTTVGTNVLVQMRGAKTGLITTRGHRDALVMMRSYGRSAGLPIEKLLHVSRHRKPDPIVPPQLIKEVSERVDWAGDVFLPLNEDEARAAVEELVAEEVDAIAISFLWGFVNPDHERRVKALVQELAPGRLRQLRARADREAGRVRAHRRGRDQLLRRPVDVDLRPAARRGHHATAATRTRS